MHCMRLALIARVHFAALPGKEAVCESKCAHTSPWTVNWRQCCDAVKAQELNRASMVDNMPLSFSLYVLSHLSPLHRWQNSKGEGVKKH